MADIDQAATGDEVQFTASSPKGDEWMRLRCGSIDVSFDLRSEALEAKAFKEAAEAAGLIIFNLASKLNHFGVLCLCITTPLAKPHKILFAWE